MSRQQCDFSEDEYFATRARALVAACFLHAVRDLRRSPDADCPNPRELALRWFASDDTHPFSFLWSCDVLDVDPGVARIGVRAHEEELHRRMPQGSKGSSITTPPRHGFDDSLPEWRRHMIRSATAALHNQQQHA